MSKQSLHVNLNSHLSHRDTRCILKLNNKNVAYYPLFIPKTMWIIHSVGNSLFKELI